MPSEDPSRYRALNLLGQARLALGDSATAIDVFREITSPARMEQLRRAEYVGVYNLGLVHAFIKRRLVPEECSHYLRQVLAVAKVNEKLLVVEQLERLQEENESSA